MSQQQMGAGIAANPHCPSYRRRRVAWRLPLGGSGRGRRRPRAVPRSAPSPLARGGCLSGSRTRPFGLASIPSGFRWARGAAAGLRRFQPGAEAPEPVPFGSGIGASPCSFAFGFGSKRTSIFRLRPRIEASSDLRPFRHMIEASFGHPPQTERIEIRFRLSVRARGEPRIGSGGVRCGASSAPRLLPSTPGGAIPASASTVAAPSAKASGAAGRLLEIRPSIRFRLCWPGFFHRPASGAQLLPFEGKKPCAFSGFGSGAVPFPGRFPSVHVPKAVMDLRVGQADSACG